MGPSYNNSFGSSGVIASGDDVAPLPSPEGSNNRRWPLVVGAVLLIVAIIAGVATFMITRNNSDSSSDNASTTSEARSAFNQYANYLLYGEDSDANLASFDKSLEYSIDKNYTDATFLTNAKNKYENFFNVIKDNPPAEIYRISILKVPSDFDLLLSQTAEDNSSDNFYAIVLREYKKLSDAGTISTEEYENYRNSLISNAVNEIKNQCYDLVEAFNGNNPYQDLENTDDTDESTEPESSDESAKSESSEEPVENYEGEVENATE